MVVCPKCQHQNMEGALICENCGMMLVPSLDQSRGTRLMDSQETKPPATAVVARGTRTFTPEARLVLILGGRPERRVITVDREIILGRVDRYTDFEPDVNLNEFGAWEHGVSRLHAAIRRDGNRLYLVDLGSSNGTYLNDEQLPSREPRLLRDGDRVRLGLFDIQLFFLYPDQEDMNQLPDE